MPVATSSVQPVSPPRHCQKEEEIHFQIGRTTKDLAFLSHESVENSIECVHKCFLQPDCEAVGFLPGVYRGVDTPGKATCIFSSQSTDNTVCGRDLGVKSYNDTLGPAVFRCFTCGKLTISRSTLYYIYRCFCFSKIS